MVQILPDGNYCPASFWEIGRRYIGNRLSLDELEKFLASYERTPDGETDNADGRQPARACLGEEDNAIEPAGVASVREPRPCQRARSLWGGQWRSTATVNCGASRPSEDVVRIWASVDPTGWRVRRTVLDPNAAGNL